MIIAILAWSSYDFFSKDKKTAEEFANKLYSYPLPPDTEIIDKGFDYGVSYGGGPWGSGGQPTVVAYMKLSSELSERKLIDYYKINSSLKDFEVYFKGDEEIIETFDGKKSWYEGKTPSNPSKKSNEGEPIELIVQKRTIFESPFGDLSDIFH
ncbi:hypothetical protein ACQKKK_15455 [Peribacillus sp. NPDC006672]|uniref:hypothetical protein n=1 Tax=Peribacillus sp. NPDC006672 TaxID=3390606 RepID=UPI003D03535D